MLVFLLGILLLALAAWVVNTQFALDGRIKMIANIVFLVILVVIVLRFFGLV